MTSNKDMAMRDRSVMRKRWGFQSPLLRVCGIVYNEASAGVTWDKNHLSAR